VGYYNSPREMFMARANKKEISAKYYWKLAKEEGQVKCYAISRKLFEEAKELRDRAELASDYWPKKSPKKKQEE